MRDYRIPVMIPRLVLACFAIALTACGGGGERGSEEVGTRVNADRVGPVCEGTPLPEAPPYAQASGIHPLNVMRRGPDGAYRYGFLDPNAYRLPEGWHARYVEELELVVCVDEETSTYFDECDYVLDDGGRIVVLSRHVKQATARLLEARTAREISTETLIAVPGECPDTIEVQEGARRASMTVGAFQEFEDWVRPYVEIPCSGGQGQRYRRQALEGSVRLEAALAPVSLCP